MSFHSTLASGKREALAACSCVCFMIFCTMSSTVLIAGLIANFVASCAVQALSQSARPRAAREGLEYSTPSLLHRTLLHGHNGIAAAGQAS